VSPVICQYSGQTSGMLQARDSTEAALFALIAHLLQVRNRGNHSQF